ncbi:RHS repeat-associated core domain-containing protein [Lysobacter sp. CFH 32150]|uniref:RHS repeat domain-containing protein n=1 Tax=Lysobacter sp. CFH 32150 TaxID=2927128 RepID=UPI001FA7B787|nr:RHS repeat-associated core domain-containing protein [Lysobacter sp. CFH 32150]MCI4567571.1 hypothetical protein [Lysobacter sp. CFH 32150]
MSFWKSGPLLALSLVAAASIDVQAAEVSPDTEYARRIKVYETVQPHGETPFGEQVNLYTGDLTFKQTDIVLEGTGPTISLVREVASSQTREAIQRPMVMGNWMLSIPRIETMTSAPLEAYSIGQPGENWVVSSSGDPNRYARCSHFDVPYSDRGVEAVWWNGIELVTESGGRQPILQRSVQNTLMPTMTNAGGNPIAFPAVTQQNWQIGCLSSTSNGNNINNTSEVGEAFFVVSPDGTKYWFDYLVGERADTIYEIDHYSGTRLKQPRMLATMYVSRIEDRFGNSLIYQYSGDKLTAITASDGRSVEIAWRTDARLIDRITVQPALSNPRVWRYEYSTIAPTYAVLSAVVLPDDSRWSFLSGLTGQGQALTDKDLNKCETRTRPNTAGGTVMTITHPSGLIGKFTVGTTWHARSYVDSYCHTSQVGQDIFDPYEDIPPLFGTVSLTRKEFSGPGLPVQAWTYTYPTAEGSTSLDPCASAGTCPDTKWVDVVDPDGNLTRYAHSNRWGVTEGKLLKTEFYQGTSTLLRSESLEYALFNQGPYPSSLGNAMTDYHSNSGKDSVWTPTKKRLITQQGTTFTWQANSFDEFAAPLSVTRSSSLGYSNTDVTDYENNVGKWVIGQVKKLTTNGIEVSRTDYHAVTALPTANYGFNKLQNTLAYYTNGTLRQVTDGRNNTITLSGWKRGIPQLIQYPATPDQPTAVSKSAQVNDNGWIDWVQDENKYRTCYGFDDMGGLTSITHPSETQLEVCDTSKWVATTRTFEPVGATEYGIPTGHWKQTVSTGNGQQVTYYDAMWRPLVSERYDAGNVAATRSVSVTRYDANGRSAFQSYPLASLSDYATVTQGNRTFYDALDRVMRVEQDSELGVLASTTEYLTGFQTKTTNPRNQAVTTSYYAYDQPTQDLPKVMLLPEGARTQVYRDAFGKPTTLVRSNADSSVWNGRYYVYDANQQLCKRVELETGTTAMGYDAAGNLAWSAAGLPWSSTTDCTIDTTGRRVDRTYDARNRIKTLTFPDGVGNQVWTYTSDSKPEQITTYNAANNGVPVINAYHYNRRRLLDGQGESISQPEWYTWGLGYGYDGNGNLSTHVYPNNVTVDYAPNALGQPTKAGTYATGVSYHPNGAIAQFTYGNGIIHTLDQNTRQLPDRSKDAYGGVSALDNGYDFDQNGNVAAISDAVSVNGNRTMTYDGLDRLKTVVSPMYGSAGANYEYDVLDNLTRVNVGGAAARDHYYCYGTNHRLEFVRANADCNSGAAITALTYDVQGNLDYKNSQNYDFDFGNRLRVVTGKEHYRYDGHGRRALAWAPGYANGNILSQYDLSGVLRYQQDTRQNKYFAYFYLGGSLVAARETPIGTSNHVVKYQHTDALGSPVAVTDASRNLIERSEYEPFGKVLNRAVHDGPGYTGHVEDTATGLTYMQQRYYDPGIGRFLSVDPVTANSNTGANFNRYWYANNNPYRFTDPDGRVPDGWRPSESFQTWDQYMEWAQAARKEAGPTPKITVISWTVVGTVSGKTEIEAAKNAAGFIVTQAGVMQMELCGRICPTKEGPFSVVITTNNGRLSCLPTGCEYGIGKSIHNHLSGGVEATAVDEVLSGYRYPEGATIDIESGFSDHDYADGPGFVIIDGALYYQEGKGTKELVQ